MMNRIALRDFFNEQAHLPQKLGTVDCVSFVAQAVRVGWNRDYLGVLQYHDRRSAVDRLRELGGLRSACDHAMGEQYPVAELEAGDVIWFDRPKTIGLLMDGYVAVKMGRTIHRLQIEPQMMGWRSGR
jgi:hypothetical protein